jgi:hypothetical protein
MASKLGRKQVCRLSNWNPARSFAAIGVSTRTKHRNVRDQLIDLARGWTAVAQHERRSDARYSVYASHHFTRNATIKTTIEAVKM